MGDKYIGTIVNFYLVLELLNDRTKYGNKLYKVKCTRCGKLLIGRLGNLKRTKKCLHHSMGINWHSDNLRKIFTDMKSRCYNTRNKSYRFYGAKGVTIYNEWLQNSQKFNDWAIENGYKNGLTIDRIDETKGYSPDNCRWITLEENSKWKSTTNIITVNGITDSGRGWAIRLGLGVNHINKYIRKNGLHNCELFIKDKLQQI